MKNNQRGIVQIILVVGVLALLAFAGYYFYVQKQKSEVSEVPSAYQAQYEEAGRGVEAVEGSGDLDALLKDLDKESAAGIDTELDALDAASSGF